MISTSAGSGFRTRPPAATPDSLASTDAAARAAAPREGRISPPFYAQDLWGGQIKAKRLKQTLCFGAQRKMAKKKGFWGCRWAQGRGGGCVPQGSPSQLVPRDGVMGGCSEQVPSPQALREGCFSSPRRAPTLARGEPQQVSPCSERPRRSASTRGFPRSLLCIS